MRRIWRLIASSALADRFESVIGNAHNEVMSCFKALATAICKCMFELRAKRFFRFKTMNF